MVAIIHQIIIKQGNRLESLILVLAHQLLKRCDEYMKDQCKSSFCLKGFYQNITVPQLTFCRVGEVLPPQSTK